MKSLHKRKASVIIKAQQQTVPCGLVVRIRRFPRMGAFFYSSFSETIAYTFSSCSDILFSYNNSVDPKNMYLAISSSASSCSPGLRVPVVSCQHRGHCRNRHSTRLSSSTQPPFCHHLLDQKLRPAPSGEVLPPNERESPHLLGRPGRPGHLSLCRY